jgi:hypothetical protein
MLQQVPAVSPPVHGRLQGSEYRSETATGSSHSQIAISVSSRRSEKGRDLRLPVGSSKRVQ